MSMGVLKVRKRVLSNMYPSRGPKERVQVGVMERTSRVCASTIIRGMGCVGGDLHESGL